MKRLDPMALARLKRQLRCPDCDSSVRIDQSVQPAHAEVLHDDTCPALAALERQGRATQVAIMPVQGETVQQFARVLADAARTLSDATGAPVALHRGPYADLNAGPAARRRGSRGHGRGRGNRDATT